MMNGCAIVILISSCPCRYIPPENESAALIRPVCFRNCSARRLQFAPRRVLERVRYTTTQTALDRSERMENLHNAFRLRKNADVRGLRVLLIDDVLTTGSTLSECARVLKRAGAISVHAATAARA